MHYPKKHFTSVKKTKPTAKGCLGLQSERGEAGASVVIAMTMMWRSGVNLGIGRVLWGDGAIQTLMYVNLKQI